MKNPRAGIYSKIKKYSTIKNIATILNRVLFSYAFISFLFWFLNCFEIDWLYHFNALFAIPYAIVKNFYVPHGVGVDFTVAIIGGLALMIGFFFELLSNNLQQVLNDLQDEEEQMIMRMRRNKAQQKKRQASPHVMGAYYGENIQDSNFVFLVTANILRLRGKKGEIDLTFQNVELWKQRVNKRLIDNISYSKPMQKGFYKNNLFIAYKDFSYVDDFIMHLRPTFDSIVNEFSKYGVTLSFSCVLSSIPEIIYLEKELDCMDTIISLELESDNVILTGRFKSVYDTKTNKKYLLKYKGDYNLSKNLTISNRQPLYVLKEKIRREEII